eukprot:Skav228805  [mRNA]  locus=scaffold359:140601:142819:+ [translate_table: standard]
MISHYCPPQISGFATKRYNVATDVGRYSVIGIVLADEIAAPFREEIRQAAVGGVGPKLVGFLANTDPAAKKRLVGAAPRDAAWEVEHGEHRQIRGYAEWTGKAMTADNLRFELRQVQESNLEDGGATSQSNHLVLQKTDQTDAAKSDPRLQFVTPKRVAERCTEVLVSNRASQFSQEELEKANKEMDVRGSTDGVLGSKALTRQNYGDSSVVMRKMISNDAPDRVVISFLKVLAALVTLLVDGIMIYYPVFGQRPSFHGGSHDDYLRDTVSPYKEQFKRCVWDAAV